MLKHSTPQTVDGAIRANQRFAFGCRACGRLQQVDLRRLSLDGDGGKRLADIPFQCECGSLDHEVIANPMLPY